MLILTYVIILTQVALLHLINQRVIDSFSKKQPLFQTDTYGYEYIVARKATQKFIELLTTLH